MNKYVHYLFFLLLLGQSPALHARINNELPLVFVPNQGQWTAPFLYKGISGSADIYLEKTGITYVVGADDNPEKIHAYKEGAHKEVPVLDYHAYRMRWLNANEAALTAGNKKQSYYHNYFIGEDKSRWKGRVPVFGNIDYQELYPGIDLHLSSEKGHLKYDFIVHPQADASAIQLAFEGTDKTFIKNGNLYLQTSVGTITEMAPYAFQYIDGHMQEVACKYKLKGQVLEFAFPDGYNEAYTLTIDPVIVFATLTGSVSDNWGFTATYDHDGNLYAGGIVNALGYPTTLGAFQDTFSGGSSGSTMPCDMSISKFNAAGNDLIYSTYLGGAGDDQPHSLVVDNNNQLIVAGKTMSTDYPVTTSAYDGSYNGGFDIVLTKFNADGTDLIGSTYIGGSGADGINITAGFYPDQNTLKFNYGDASRSEVIVDNTGNIYMVASSQSTNFPVTANAAKSTLGGLQDGVFFKLNPTLSNLIYSTFIGGSAADAAYVLTLDTAQTHIYVGGGTSSTDFHPSAVSSGWQSSYQGGMSDGYICRFSNGGSYPLLGATFIGTAAYDQAFGIQCDLENAIYAMGQTTGAFPVSAGVYSNPGSPQFLIKLNNLLSIRTYSTVFGNGSNTAPNISPVAFLVDTCQNVYISGWGAGSISPGSTTTGLPITADAFQSTTDGSDFYFIVFSKNALSLLFGSYFGSPGKAEHVDGGTSRFDPQGVVYQAICASCFTGSAFPATPGAYATVKGSSNCNLGAVKIAFNLGSVNAVAAAEPDSTGCAPFTVQFDNSSTNATSFTWDFGDGSGNSTAMEPTHTFTEPGSYEVRMVAVNPNACKTHDTVYLTINVSDAVIEANFDYILEDTCTQPRVSFTNTSIPMPGHTLNDAQFQWFFGDGSSFNGQVPPEHLYEPGTYTMMLVMNDAMACNNPDTLIQTLTIQQLNVEAGLLPVGPICVGDTITFQNTSNNGTAYQWSFGDGHLGTGSNESHFYAQPGTYTLWLKASNPLSCNKSDSTSITIVVYPKPVAAFSYTPIIPETNVPITFHNQSQHAVRYVWDFGDGSGSTETDPVHQYNRTGTFTVCLTAFTDQDCPDRICKNVYTEVVPLADVPTAFSPNGDGINDGIFVRGFSIKEMDFKIFNRWGELVFESFNQENGWDGTYKGQLQEMDAYAFILKVTFYDGTTTKRQGNITLLR